MTNVAKQKARGEAKFKKTLKLFYNLASYGSCISFQVNILTFFGLIFMRGSFNATEVLVLLISVALKEPWTVEIN